MFPVSLTKGAITAFAGVDPGVNESGSYEQKSVPTSKRGSSDLRKTLFQVMDVLIKTHPQDDPYLSVLRKKTEAQKKPYYVNMTASANKFLRICLIFNLYKIFKVLSF